MSIAFRAPVTSTQKLVLLALCDSANDSGECYPSVSLLVEKCSLSDRAIQKAITELEQLGQLRRELRVGRSTVYWMTPNTNQPPNDVHPTPERGSPITIKEPSIETSPNRKRSAPKVEVPADLLVEAGFDLKTAVEFIEHKRGMKAPLTERAWADHVREAAKAGWSVVDAAEKVMARSWRGFEARYVQAQQPPMKASKHAGFETKDYHAGANADGSF